MARHGGAGGRIAPDGRPPQAKGVGKNAKRHDLERPATPGLAGSDLQQGDVQALESGQRIAPIKQNPRGQAPPVKGGSTSATPSRGTPPGAPDAIEFLGAQQGNEFNIPSPVGAVINERALSWMPIIRSLVVGPGSSGLLASAFINQARQLRKSNSSPSVTIDLDSIDDGLEAMLNELGA